MGLRCLPYAIVTVRLAVENRIILPVLRASTGTQVSFSMVVRQNTTGNDVRLGQHDFLDLGWSKSLALSIREEHASEQVTVRHPPSPCHLCQKTRLLVGTNLGTDSIPDCSKRALAFPKCLLTL